MHRTRVTILTEYRVSKRRYRDARREIDALLLQQCGGGRGRERRGKGNYSLSAPWRCAEQEMVAVDVTPAVGSRFLGAITDTNGDDNVSLYPLPFCPFPVPCLSAGRLLCATRSIISAEISRDNVAIAIHYANAPNTSATVTAKYQECNETFTTVSDVSVCISDQQTSGCFTPVLVIGGRRGKGAHCETVVRSNLTYLSSSSSAGGEFRGVLKKRGKTPRSSSSEENPGRRRGGGNDEGGERLGRR